MACSTPGAGGRVHASAAEAAALSARACQRLGQLCAAYNYSCHSPQSSRGVDILAPIPAPILAPILASCLSLLQEDVHDAFVDLLVAKVQSLQLGPGSDPGTTHGPLITAAAVDGVSGEGLRWFVSAGTASCCMPARCAACLPSAAEWRIQPSKVKDSLASCHGSSDVQRQTGMPPSLPQPPQVEAKVQDALAKGAVAATGGRRPDWGGGSPLEGGFFFEPTVLTGASVLLPGRLPGC